MNESTLNPTPTPTPPEESTLNSIPKTATINPEEAVGEKENEQKENAPDK